jgi:hypothetical protein
MIGEVFTKKRGNFRHGKWATVIPVPQSLLIMVLKGPGWVFKT